MLVFGTRPEAIKMAPLVKCLKQQSDKFEPIVCVTGQHREMLDQVLKIFEIKPDYDLNIMKQGQDLYDVTSKVLLGMREVLNTDNPDIVLVHGDTSTSTAAALAAFYQQIPVGHVEAGLRTYNIYSPWPEEMNRQLTGRIATLDFAPTPLSRKNLLNEGVGDEHIFVTGNTVIDALHIVVNKIKSDEQLNKNLSLQLKEQGYDVIGCTLALFAGSSCCNKNTYLDAKRVCMEIGIPHFIFDCQDNFRKYVIDDFTECYACSKTPNPCIECNKYIKFGYMYDKAKEMGCSCLKTNRCRFTVLTSRSSRTSGRGRRCA